MYVYIKNSTYKNIDLWKIYIYMKFIYIQIKKLCHPLSMWTTWLRRAGEEHA
jgi:hypothetical protein